MKKFLGIILVVSMMFMLVACKEEQAPDNNNYDVENDQGNLLDGTIEEDDGETTSEGIKIEEEKVILENVVETNFPVEDLNKYDVFQFIRLVENPTTGYQWTYAFAPEGIAVVEADEYTAPELEGGIVGAAGEHTYRISGLAEGETDLVFTYARSWEPIEEAAKVVTFRLSVDADMNVAVISEN